MLFSSSPSPRGIFRLENLLRAQA